MPGRDDISPNYWDFSKDVEEKLNDYFTSQPGYLGRQENGRYRFNVTESRLEVELSGLDETLLEVHGNASLPEGFVKFFTGLGGRTIPKKEFHKLKKERQSEDDDPVAHIPDFERAREPEGFSHLL